MAVRVVSLDMVAVPIQLQSSLSSSSVAIPRGSRLLWRVNFPRRHTTTGRVAASPSSTLKVDRPSPTAYSGARTRLTQQEAQVELAVEAPVFPDHSTTNSEQAKFATATGPSAGRARNWFQQLAASALDVVERDWIPRIEDGRPLPSTTDPRMQLEGNFAPVPEHPVEHELEVEGNIPACLEGVYLRNGANPQFPPLAGHHLFDGDGMVHAVRFNQGLASYCCRYTRTYRYQEEARAGRPVFPKPIGELHGHGGVARLLLYGARALCGLVDASRGMGAANAGLVFHDGKLLAMSEDDLPYRVRITPDGDLETEGRFDFDGQLGAGGVQSMIAHPKVDPVTGELFNLSYNVLAAPFLKYFRVSADGQKSPEVDITLQQPTMMHDFAITESFVVVPDQQVVFRMQELLSGGSPVLYDGAKAARFGLLPRYDTDETRMQWFPVPDCFCFHLWNAWEEPARDEVVVIASCMTPADSIFNESDQALASILSEIRLDRRTGRASRREIAPGLNLEAGMVAKKVVGRKSRFAYLAVAEPWPKVSGVAKVDLLAGAGSGEESVVVARIRYPDNCYGGEPCFVPRSDDPADSEDDGYIVTFMHNEGSGKSQLLVLDARSPTLAPVAKLQLPSRVPYGFHGTYVPAKELAKQADPMR